jgi:hypothetical protein
MQTQQLQESITELEQRNKQNVNNNSILYLRAELNSHPRTTDSAL